MTRHTIKIAIPPERNMDVNYAPACIRDELRKKGIAGKIMKSTPIRRTDDFASRCMLYIVEVDVERIHGKPYAPSSRRFRRPAFARGY